MVSWEMSTSSVSDISAKTAVLSRPVLSTFTMKGIGKQGSKYPQDRFPLSGKQNRSCVFWTKALPDADSDVLPRTSMVLAAEAFWEPDHTLSDVTFWGWWTWGRGLDSSAPRPCQQSSDLHLHSLQAVSEKPSCPLNLSAASQILRSQLWEKKAGEGCPETLTWNSVALRYYLFGFYFVLFEVGPFPDWPPAHNPPPFLASQVLGLQAWTIAPSPTFSLNTDLVLW